MHVTTHIVENDLFTLLDISTPIDSNSPLESCREDNTKSTALPYHTWVQCLPQATLMLVREIKCFEVDNTHLCLLCTLIWTFSYLVLFVCLHC